MCNTRTEKKTIKKKEKSGDDEQLQPQIVI